MTLLPTHSKKDMIINSLNEENKELSNQLHSLRLAVLEYMTHFHPDETLTQHKKLALSAGIHFENGVWKLSDK